MTVLIVGDDPQMRSLLSRGLIDEGYAVDISTSGADGKWINTEYLYDAIVIDVTLPGSDGGELCRKVRATRPWMPIIVVTARESIEDRVRALDAGADDYLMQPVSFAELSARLRAVIRRHIS